MCVRKSVNIVVLGSHPLVYEMASGNRRFFHVKENVEARVEGITLQNARNANENGGAFWVDGKVVFVNGWVVGNHAAKGGGYFITSNGEVEMITGGGSSNTATVGGYFVHVVVGGRLSLQNTNVLLGNKWGIQKENADGSVQNLKNWGQVKNFEFP